MAHMTGLVLLHQNVMCHQEGKARAPDQDQGPTVGDQAAGVLVAAQLDRLVHLFRIS
jgi:hypothetical protein